MSGLATDLAHYLAFNYYYFILLPAQCTKVMISELGI